MRYHLIILISVLAVGCSTVRTITVNTTASIMQKASSGMELEQSWEYFRNSTPANLKTLEGLYYLESDNLDLLVTLTKGHSAYGIGVYETILLEKRYCDRPHGEIKKYALYHYSQAIRYGLEYFKSKGLDLRTFRRSLKENSQKQIEIWSEYLSLDDSKDVSVLFFMAQAWAGLIYLQQNNIELMSQLPYVMAIAEWVCSKHPDFYYGACGVLQGAYYASKPKIYGGDPEKGKKYFLEAIKKWPGNAFNMTAYLQYMVIPQMDESTYNEYKSTLEQLFSCLEKNKQWGGIWSENGDCKNVDPHMNLLNAIARERFDAITNCEDKLF